MWYRRLVTPRRLITSGAGAQSPDGHHQSAGGNLAFIASAIGRHVPEEASILDSKTEYEDSRTEDVWSTHDGSAIAGG